MFELLAFELANVYSITEEVVALHDFFFLLLILNIVSLGKAKILKFVKRFAKSPLWHCTWKSLYRAGFNNSARFAKEILSAILLRIWTHLPWGKRMTKPLRTPIHGSFFQKSIATILSQQRTSRLQCERMTRSQNKQIIIILCIYLLYCISSHYIYM